MTKTGRTDQAEAAPATVPVGPGLVDFLGGGLNRPECVLCHDSGRVFVPDWRGRGGVAMIEPDGAVRRITIADGGPTLRPNGIAMEPGGSFLLAHLGDGDGGVWRLDPDGTVSPVLTELNGTPMPPTNFVLRDDRGRLWITVSTRHHPRARAYRGNVADGFIVLFDGDRARIVADGLGYANECALHPDGRRLFVNETFARRTLCFDIAADGGLVNRQVIAEYGAGTFPDGLAFDAEGGFWITSIVSNRLLRVLPDGEIQIVLEDCDPVALADIERAFAAGTMGRPHLDTAIGATLKNVSSLAFGGTDLRTGHLGCLLGDAVGRLRLPVAGHPPPHWRNSLDRLDAALAGVER